MRKQAASIILLISIVDYPLQSNCDDDILEISHKLLIDNMLNLFAKNTKIIPLEQKCCCYPKQDNKKPGVGILCLFYDEVAMSTSNHISSILPFRKTAKQSDKIILKNIEFSNNSCHFGNLIPFHHDDAWPFREGLAKIKSHDKWSFVDKTGKKVVLSCNDDICSFNEGLAKVPAQR